MFLLVKSKTASDTVGVKQKLEYRNGISDVELSERNAGIELYGWNNRNAKCTKQYEENQFTRCQPNL